MTSSSIKSIFYSTRSATDLYLYCHPENRGVSWGDNHAVVSSFLAPTYELAFINSPALGSFHSPPSVVLFLSLLPYCSSSAAAPELRVFVDFGRCITLIRPENRGEPSQLTCLCKFLLPRRTDLHSTPAVLPCSSPSPTSSGSFHFYCPFLILALYRTTAVAV